MLVFGCGKFHRARKMIDSQLEKAGWYLRGMVKFMKTAKLGASIRMCVATISSKFQITIPKEIRERFIVKPGDKVLFIPRGRTLELVFARSSKELEEVKRLHSKTSEFSPSGTMLENSKV
jgi:AbrB family looped-hinge helix DNA binding protein